MQSLLHAPRDGQLTTSLVVLLQKPWEEASEGCLRLLQWWDQMWDRSAAIALGLRCLFVPGKTHTWSEGPKNLVRR